MKIVAKCSAFINLSNQVHVHVKVCNPIPLSSYVSFQTLHVK